MPPSIASRKTVWYVLMSFATIGPVGIIHQKNVIPYMLSKTHKSMIIF